MCFLHTPGETGIQCASPHSVRFRQFKCVTTQKTRQDFFHFCCVESWRGVHSSGSHDEWNIRCLRNERHRARLGTGYQIPVIQPLRSSTSRHRWLREITSLAKRPGPFAKHNRGKTERVPQVVKVCLFNDSQQETRCLSSRGSFSSRSGQTASRG
jgi:hypothetical protein